MMATCEVHISEETTKSDSLDVQMDNNIDPATSMDLATFQTQKCDDFMWKTLFEF